MCVNTDNKSTTQTAGKRFLGSVTGLINRIGGFVSKDSPPNTNQLRGKDISPENAYSFGKRNPIAGSAGTVNSQAAPAAGPDGEAVLDGGAIRASMRRNTADADDTGARIRYVLTGICFAGMGFLLGNAPSVMGANPFGTALLCAASKYTGFIYAGLLGSALLSDHAVMRLCVYSLAIGLRILISASCAAPSQRETPVIRKPSGSFFSRTLDFALSPPPGILSEPLTLRVCAGLSAALISGLWRIVAGGFLIYDLLGTMFELAAAPAAVFLFAGAFDRTEHKNKVEHALHAVSDAPYRELGMLTLLAALVYSIKLITFYGFSAAAILAVGAVYLVANKGGVLRACATGLICGLVYNPELAPAFGLAGLTAGLLQGLGVLGMCAATCAVGGAYGVYASGFEALRTLVPDLIGASGIYAAALRLGLLPKVVLFTSSIAPPDERAREAAVAIRRQKSDERRLSAMSEAMKSLSEVFYTLSDRLRRPGIYDARRLCDEIFARRCPRCRNCTRCAETGVPEHAAELLARAVGAGEASDDDALNTELSHDCYQIKNIRRELDEAHAKLLEDAARFNNTEIFALDYGAAAKLLSEAAAFNRDEYAVDEERSEKLRRAARYLDLGASNIAVYGTRRRCVIAGGVDLSRVKLSAAKLSDSFGRVCGSMFGPPRFELDGDYATMTLTSRRKFEAHSASSACSKRDGEPNGDTQTAFDNTEDYYYAIISDGMGSGREAALTSRLCCVFLERMLSAGNRKSITLEMLNNFIRCKNIECHATVDMLEIDLLDGSASFIKSGAATSYLLRNGRLFAISATAMPVGLTREINAEEIKFGVENGDIIVMISDGVASNSETSTESVWLTELLAAEQEAACTNGFDPDALARKIVDEAKLRGESGDDITALVTQINQL
jgi:Serine phosphatase RsbU, regulator of sigma subunit